MLRVAVLLCVVAATYGWGSEMAIKKYAHMKILSSCMGEEVITEWMTKAKDAAYKCKHEGVSMTDMPSYRQYLMNLRSGASKPEYVPVPVPYYFPQQQQGQMMNQFRSQFNQAAQNPFQSMNRVKRSEHTSLDHLEEKMKNKVGNITCVLQEMGFMDEKHQPIYDAAVTFFKDLQIADDLKADLLDAMDMCKDFAMCLPVEKAKHPLKKELGTAMGYFKCTSMMEIKVCMKHDMKKYAAEMGHAEDPMMSEIEEFEQLVM